MICEAGPPVRRSSRTLELADVFRAHGDRLGPMNPRQQQAARAIIACRTADLGGHLQACDHCGFRQISYNSCRDRHCPKCQGLSATRWVEARKADLLPVPYFHVVFTLPTSLHPIFRAHPKIAYGLLFGAVSETLLEAALNPKNLGARIGLTAILHTWTQQLLFHPHIHCIVPAGGLDPAGVQWVSAKPGFFLPVRLLSKLFRGKLLSKLEAALAEGRIRLSDDDPTELLRLAAQKTWVVFAKAPFAGPEQVIQYLGRYTHRIAISNDRLVSMDEGKVTFRWRDRAQGNQVKLLTLEAVEFLRRFLQHVVPRGVVRIRHYGLLANPVRRRRIARCRELLGVDPPGEDETETWQQLLLRVSGIDVTRCPECRIGHMEPREDLSPSPSRRWIRGSATSP